MARWRRRAQIVVGTAGWSIPRASAADFAGDGTHLERYGRRLRGAEINSCFYRPHAPRDYAKWAAATPAVVPLRGQAAEDHHARSAAGAGPCAARAVPRRDRAGSAESAARSSSSSRRRSPSMRAWWAASWRCCERATTGRSSGSRATRRGPRRRRTRCCRSTGSLASRPIRRRFLRPPCPGGWPGLVYYRLHGSPRTYWSSYDALRLGACADALRRVPPGAEAWCVFDNTASGAALQNAVELDRLLRQPDQLKYIRIDSESDLSNG